MNSPFAKTAMMGVVAALISAVAAAYYPWPEMIVENDLVGKPLVKAYDASTVRSISIIKYDPDRNGLDRIELRRRGEQWVIPANKNFVATNSAQISLAINSLTGNVLEARSSDQQDHVEYGVVDPSEFETTTNRGSLGTKIVLEDRNNRELASLIVGDSPSSEPNRDRQKHFVRIPGQPNVYVMEIPRDALATQFTRWVSSNLLGLSSDVPVESITINSYRMKPGELTEGERDWNYEVQIDAKNAKRTLRIARGESGELQAAEFTDAMLAPFRELGGYIGNIVFTDVQKKSAAASAVLKKRGAVNSADLDALNEFGFASIDSEPDKPFGLRFNALGGEVVVRSANGVAISILIGSIVETKSTDAATVGLALNYYVMLYATIDESMFPSPEPPEGQHDSATESNLAASDDAEKVQKAYLRSVAAREEKIKTAVQRAAELNQTYADWYFIVSEQIINGLRPELSSERMTSAPAESDRPSSSGDESESIPESDQAE